MMGSGKSTVGAVLATLLSQRFVDTDVEIERAAGQTVTELFASEGEAGFRDRERAAIASVAGELAVVATGAGAIAQPGAARRLADCGTVVYLRAKTETLLARLGAADTRPLLQGLPATDRERRLSALLDDRREAYESATVVVDTDGLAADEVAGEIAQRLGQQASA
jgi:shikimate kinase